MKRKVIIILVISIAVLFISGITYSKFTSTSSLAFKDQFLAKFIFEAKETNKINLPLTDLNPGDEVVYNFSVTNNKGPKTIPK